MRATSAGAAAWVNGPLIEAVGAEPFDIGDLSQAGHLEAMAIAIIQTLRNGTPVRSAFNLVPADA